MTPNKREVLQDTTFGARIAEEERSELSAYFVETDQWRRIFSGEIDIVYGAKGSGKSAIYSLLINRTEQLFDAGIMAIPAENPRGTPVFKDLIEDPPTDETEFRTLWKLYFLSLIAHHLREYGISTSLSKSIVDPLEKAGLLQKQWSLRTVLRSVVDYARDLTKAESFEGGLKIDPTTGNPIGITGKITIREPSSAQRASGLVSADNLLETADLALKESELNLWLLVDRLDVAFSETEDLERNALRALFRVYLDLLSFDAISLKIFLRSDIWSRISGLGFREGSHVTRHVTIRWDKASLLNLVIRRLVHNEMLRGAYNVEPSATLQDAQEQSKLFYRLFPKQIDVGTRNPDTFTWMLSRTSDASNETAPRELIHLLSAARELQLGKLEVGSGELSDESLFERSVFKEALRPVSEVRFTQTLCAEYPQLQKWLRALEGEKTQQRAETLANIWDVDQEQAVTIADELVEIGFFERRTTKEESSYRVPFLYRDALRMSQGSA